MQLPLRASLMALIGLLVLAVGAPAAQASIVLGKGAAGIQLGDSKDKVTSILGQPFRKASDSWVYAKPCLCTVEWQGRLVHSIDTLSKSQRTDKGIGVGSSLKATVVAYPEARCYHPKVFSATSRKCVISSPNGAKTAFVFFEEDLPMRDVEIWR
jgi:hypothetical protein